LKLTRGTSEPRVANTADSFDGVPGKVVHSIGPGREEFLRETSASVVAVLGTGLSLASNSVVAGEAVASTRLAVASSAVRALGPRVEVISIDNISNPSKVVRASSEGAVGTGPLGHAVEAEVALAVGVGDASAVARAVMLAVAAASVPSLLVPDGLSPGLHVDGGG